MSDSTQDHAATPCPDREEALALHAGGDLPPAEARALETHLTRCPGCRAFVAELEQSRSALAALAAETPPGAGLADVHRRVMEEVRADGESGKERGLFGAGGSWRWAAVAAVALALGAALVWRLGPESGPEPPVPPGDERVWIARSEPPESPSTDREEPAPEPADTRPDGNGERTPRRTVPEPTSPDPTPRELEPTAPPTETEIRRASADDRPDLKIQLVSDDPDIVIYWLVDMEEPTDVPTTAPSTT